MNVLFAFLLTVPLAARFPELSTFQRYDYFVTLLAGGGASVLLVTDLLFHGAAAAITAGLAALALVALWCLLPLRRRASLQDRR